MESLIILRDKKDFWYSLFKKKKKCPVCDQYDIQLRKYDMLAYGRIFNYEIHYIKNNKYSFCFSCFHKPVYPEQFKRNDIKINKIVDKIKKKEIESMSIIKAKHLENHSTKVFTGTEWIPARGENYKFDSLLTRLKGAFGVLTGKYDALDWEEPEIQKEKSLFSKENYYDQYYDHNKKSNFKKQVRNAQKALNSWPEWMKKSGEFHGSKRSKEENENS